MERKCFANYKKNSSKVEVIHRFCCDSVDLYSVKKKFTNKHIHLPNCPWDLLRFSQRFIFL